MWCTDSGINSPWNSQANTSIDILSVKEHILPPAATMQDPIRTRGRIDTLSTRTPNGRFDRVIPRMTKETDNETTTRSTPN